MVRKHFEQLGRQERIEVLADSRLEPGAVIFETARGNLDASIETQLQEIQRGLSDRLHRANA
jgi:flagellar assembly protein FliH